MDNTINRVTSALFMTCGLSLILASGTLPISIFILALEFLAFCELIRIRKIMDWFDVWAFTGINYVLISLLTHNINPIPLFFGAMATLITFIRRTSIQTVHKNYEDLLWLIFSLSLCILAVFHIANLIRGLGWFLLPVIYTTLGDIGGYIMGRIYGKRNLASLSPKKTMEGFYGGVALVISMAAIFGSIIGNYSRYFEEYFPSGDKPIFDKDNELVNWGVLTITSSMTKFEIHNLVIAFLSATIGQMAGLFASGIKRSHNIKDFSNIIPGHGGIVDRVDCISYMGLLTYLYYNIVL